MHVSTTESKTLRPRYIGKEVVAQHLSMESCIGLMGDAMRDLVGGQSLQPLRSIMWLPERRGGLGMMPAYAAKRKRLGIKVLTVFPANRASGYSSHQGLVVLCESEHGQLLAMVDADEITAIRTAAVSGLATKLLSRDAPSNLAVLGSGTQALRHVEAMFCVRSVRSVKVWSREYSHAEGLARQVNEKYGRPSLAVRESKDAVADADIICTVTASPTPVVYGEWVKKGAHINAVGSCIPSARECDTATVRMAKLYTDRYESLFKEAGDFIIAKKEGAIDDGDVRGELGEVLTGLKRGRETDDEVTMFKSLGIGIEDIYAADFVYERVIKMAVL